MPLKLFAVSRAIFNPNPHCSFCQMAYVTFFSCFMGLCNMVVWDGLKSGIMVDQVCLQCRGLVVQMQFKVTTGAAKPPSGHAPWLHRVWKTDGMESVNTIILIKIFVKQSTEADFCYWPIRFCCKTKRCVMINLIDKIWAVPPDGYFTVCRLLTDYYLCTLLLQLIVEISPMKDGWFCKQYLVNWKNCW